MVFVAGTGTFAADVAEVAVDAGHEVGGFIELLDRSRVGGRLNGLAIVGIETASGAAVIGTGRDRRAVCDQLAAHGWGRTVVVHPTAHLPASVEIEPGCFVGPGVVVGAASRLGEDALLGRGVLLGHHTSVGARSVLNPGANVAGNVLIGEDAFLGIGCVVRDHVAIGPRAVVAAGAVVVSDVPGDTQVRGLPARATQ